MKSLLATWGAVLLLAGFAASGARSQTCFDFDSPMSLCFDFNNYSDGLELTSSGGVISGWWLNCTTSADCPVSGFRVHGDPGGGGWVVCESSDENPCPDYLDWGFYIDGPLDGTMLGYVYYAGEWLFFDLVGYTVYPGPCPFGPEDSAGELGTESQLDYDR